MKQVAGVVGAVVFSAFLCAPVFAEEPEKIQKHADQEAKEEQGEHKADASHVAAPFSTATQTPSPMPPGLEKRGKVPPGLEKKGKTPHGWSQGKAGWKHPGQTSPAHHGSHSGNGGVVGGGHTAHSNAGHGHY